MELFKKLFLMSTAALLLACGGGGGDAPAPAPTPNLAVTITGAGSAAANGSFTVANGTVVTITCNMACTVTPSGLNAAYTNTSTTANSWTGKMVGSSAAGTVTATARSGVQTPVSTIINVLPALTVTVTGAGAGNSPYAVANNTQVTLTCNMACAFAPTITNASYNVVSTNSTTWVGTMLNSGVDGNVTVTASAAGQTAVSKVFSLLAPLSNTVLQNLAKSGNTGSYAIWVAESQFSFLARNLEPLTGSGTNQALPGSPTICTTGSYTATWNSLSPTLVTIGDFLAMTYTNCDGYNGTARFTFTGFPNSGRSGSIVFTNFKFTTSGGTETVISNNSLSWTRTTYGTYPEISSLTGSMLSNVTSASSIFLPGLNTFSLTNINFVRKATSATVVSEAYTFDSNDGVYNYKVTNVTPKESTSSVTTTSGVTDITYSAAKLRVTSSSIDTTITGTNTDGSVINPILLGSQYYF